MKLNYKKIRRLLMGGVGFAEYRGDMLEVISVPFALPEQPVLADLPIWEHENFNTWVRWLAAALVIIVVLMTLVRPAMRKLLYPNQSEDGTPLDEHGLPIINRDSDGLGLIGSDLDGSDGFDLSSSGLDLPNLHKDEDLLKAVRALVANEPDLAAQVVKTWVNEDG